ncbi:MAG: zinc-dependent alcohol dehydrogenase family protein [Candidatus Marinimicrobia bacterium]|nr:zinc-dependent alcohol dehydrogenase family protein [Candidatus Neomarinimicrobiota bacterium]MCF7827664.1 zinc-dependent alcohol dehydrogenase family protein [Candidatus Neomarinimicrobiota bacterium]MCF7881281.1 zinc-dependent alcohol dehydrogenase family protein [Candidatus Neomarinimicrobiota bacterium]
MRAMVITDFGDTDVFEEQDWEKPTPGPTELLVKVHATSINPVDFKIRQAGSWAGVEPPAIIGYDVSGVVEGIGDGVKDFEPGDEVFYTPEIFKGQGSYAEYHVADESIVAKKPKNISHEEAATIPLAGATAYDAMITRGIVEAGDTVLIHGAGGVGALATQIAVAAGARVITVCSDYMEETVTEYGAEPINYKTDNFVEIVHEKTDGDGVDLVFDTVGGNTMTQSIDVTKSHGRMVNIVGTNTDLSRANFPNITVHFLFIERERYKLDRLRTLIEREQLKPLVDSVMELQDVSEAHRRLEKGGVKGKIALKV